MSAQSLKGRIHAVATFWIAKQSLEHLEAIRMQELSTALEHIPAGSSILEIGAGTGWQARELERHGHAVSAIDLASSNYRAHLVWPVTEYDGEHIPFPNNSFDIVFSSNVLEHIPHLPEFETEIIRVLKPTGQLLLNVPIHHHGSRTFLSGDYERLRALFAPYSTSVGGQLPTATY